MQTGGVYRVSFIIFYFCGVVYKLNILKDFKNAPPAKMLIYCQNVIF